MTPVLPRDFVATHWERSPLALHGEPGRFNELFSLAEVDRLISSGRGRHPFVRTVKATTNGSPDGRGEKASGRDVYEEYRNGATIVLHGVHEHCPGLADLCRALSRDLSAALQVNAYLTPPNAQGLSYHYDTHDVFVLQVEGSKHWRIWNPPVRLPLRSQVFDPRRHVPESLVEELDLSSGDLLYLPRGFLHEAVSGDSTSLHLTVGVHPTTWAAALLGAVEECIERDPVLRESLPPGFADDAVMREELEGRLTKIIGSLADKVDASATIADATERALAARRAVEDGRLLDLEAARAIGEETRLRRRPDVHWTLSCADDVVLRFEGKLMRLPGHTAPQVRFLVEGKTFTAAELPGDLDIDGRLLLVRRLVEEGFLTTRVDDRWPHAFS